jgi:hypothetical protein
MPRFRKAAIQNAPEMTMGPGLCQIAVWRTVVERAVSVVPERRLFEDIGFSEGNRPARQKLELPRRIALRTPLHSISFRLPQSSQPNDFVVLLSCL